MLFIPPRFTFEVALLQDAVMLATFFLIATVTGVLTARIRAREKALLQREERATALYSLTKDLSVANSLDDVARATVNNIRKFFNAEVIVFLSETDGDIFKKAHPLSSFQIEEKEFGVASWVYWNEKKAGKFTGTLPFAQATYYPVSGPRYPLGVIGVKQISDNRIGTDQEILLENFIRQIASTIEREQLNEVAKRSVAYIESERLYKTIFNSISHELRTPVAAIISASEGLMHREDSAPAQTRQDFVAEIQTAATRLNRLVENLLDMTRLETGRIQPKSDWCDVNDLVGTSIRKLADELSAHTVSVDIPSGFPLVLADFALIEQAITNLMHNASLYTPVGSAIVVRAFTGENVWGMEISDNGPGIPPEILPMIFDKFYRVPGTKAGGTGLGLSIAKGFIEAHGGTLAARNKPEGGASFILTLPHENKTVSLPLEPNE
ncbi:MAG: ATP-binding protein [bacterium]